MSRLTDLLRQVHTDNPALGKDLAAEIEHLQKRKAFGLNFERHKPETVELPGRAIRKGDKVRFLPERGSNEKVDRRLWKVTGFETIDDTRYADLKALAADRDGTVATDARAVEDLVVVAEFFDPIYPGLRSTGTVERGGDKPYHAVINAENYHALEALLYTHEGKVDAIYIDPPYNTGAKDWKYNNAYVDSEDLYRHSKWLSFIEKRLKLAKRLLNPENSVLIFTIDEKEYLRAGLLLQQVFPEAHVQMVSSVINPKGIKRQGLSRVDEYIFFVLIGEARIAPQSEDMLYEAPADGPVVRWRGLARSGANALRSMSPGAYYPIFIDRETGKIVGAGEVPASGVSRPEVPLPDGAVAVWPPSRPTGEDGRWSVVRETFLHLHAKGAVRTGRVDVDKGLFPMTYLTSEQMSQIDLGTIKVTGRDADGSMIVEYAQSGKKFAPKSVWTKTSHSASEHGSTLLSKVLPGRHFPFPKSLYAVEDALRFFVCDKPNAVVVDFFGGSGTTAHAVMRLNKQDGGRRRAIVITNNEVSAEEQAILRKADLRPGDPGWENLGICSYITKPRISSVITGRTPEGDAIKGSYKFTDEFPIAEGFEENVEFFDLTYESPLSIRHNRAFTTVAPLLWMRAGSRGRRIEHVTNSFDLADAYGVLFDLDTVFEFVAAVKGAGESVEMVFVVTDDEHAYQMVCGELPDHVEPVRLYESYLTNFTINNGSD